MMAQMQVYTVVPGLTFAIPVLLGIPQFLVVQHAQHVQLADIKRIVTVRRLADVIAKAVPMDLYQMLVLHNAGHYVITGNMQMEILATSVHKVRIHDLDPEV